MKRVTILGSTGSVGCSTVDLLARHPERYEVEALTANGNVDLLAEQARRLRAKLAVVADDRRYSDLKRALEGTGIAVASGVEGLREAAARPAEWVMAAIVGFAGLPSILVAAERGATIALANKEALVCAGRLLLDAIKRGGGTLMPVDSEHNAIFQCLEERNRDRVERLILTASGGPFRNWSLAEMAAATPAQAMKHPNWEMGAKISIDSATMMNKGLELIEAHILFGVVSERIEIVIHPQSVIHSMVAYSDGSVLAQLGSPDMRTPIAHALAWPERIETPSERLDFRTVTALTFEVPDIERFPALRLAREALQTGGISTTIMNAANEIAVGSFLASEIGFLDIARIVEDVRTRLGKRMTLAGDCVDFAALQAVDEEARTEARALCTARRQRV